MSSGRALLRAAAATAPAFGAILAIWLAAAVAFATILYWLERHASYTTASMLDSLYMVVITMTTVGYGDMTPVTPAGKIFSCLCAYTGCVLAALPAVVLVTKLAQCSQPTARKEGGARGRAPQPATTACTSM